MELSCWSGPGIIGPNMPDKITGCDSTINPGPAQYYRAKPDFARSGLPKAILD